MSVPIVMSSTDGLRMGLRLRAFITENLVHCVAIYSRDLASQVMPQALELLVSTCGARDRLLIDGRSGVIERIGHFSGLRTLAKLPVECARVTALTARETIEMLRLESFGSESRFRRATIRRVGQNRIPPRVKMTGSTENWIVAIWPASEDLLVGGAVTHVSGILGGFRSAGYRVALVVMVSVGDQVVSAVDEVIVPKSLDRGVRLSRGIECLGVNEALRDAALRVARRVRPVFIYQRHSYLSIVGAQVASASEVPLVLEWNNSAVWAWSNMRRSADVPRVLSSSIRLFALQFERRAVTSASVIAAVSEPAATMAYEAGAPRSAVVVVPNGVDISAIDRAIENRDEQQEEDSLPGSGEDRGASSVVGWVGSFGPWHGADMLIRALAILPVHISALMIGSGSESERCRSFARRLGVAERIEFTGALPHSEAVRRLARCDLLVSPHVDNFGRRFFGSPTKVFEYMAIGLPIVASRLEQIGEVLEDGVTARLVAPGDVPALAKGILDTLGGDGRGAELGVNARRTAEECHTWESRAALILDVIGAPNALMAPRSRSTSASGVAE
jgi:glycosyltransferase involved in cell wall biosynthesis